MKPVSKLARLLVVAVSCCAIGLGIGLLARASVPTGIAYSGILRDQAGKPLDGMYKFKFELIDGNATLCTQPDQMLTVANGRFDVPNLFAGNGCMLDSILKSNQSLSIQITVDGTVLKPPQPIGAVPYSLRARVAETTEQRPAYTNGNKSMYLDAKPCGYTAPMNGNLGGHAATKTLCENTCKSATARMCTPDDLLRFIETGGSLNPPNNATTIWIGHGTRVPVGNGYPTIADCLGWTNGTNNWAGGAFYNRPPWTNDWQTCDNAQPVACCD